MKEAPPKNFEFDIIESFENELSVCLVYQFSKSEISTPMAQVFKIADNKITEILLVFDTKAFKK